MFGHWTTRQQEGALDRARLGSGSVGQQKLGRQPELGWQWELGRQGEGGAVGEREEGKAVVGVYIVLCYIYCVVLPCVITLTLPVCVHEIA